MTLQTQQLGARHIGDINLVAAIMSLGIPLDQNEPVFIVEGNGGNYGSYSVMEYSDDGSESIDQLLEHWQGTAPLPSDHGFSQICEFIRARPRGIQRSDELLDFAVDYLQGKGHPLPGLKRLDDVPSFVSALPTSEASHVLAYVWNRALCFDLYRVVSRRIYLEEGKGKETRRALLDTRLPKWKAKEFLSRLQG